MDAQLELSLKVARSRAMSVTQLVRTARETLEFQLGSCRVEGEVSNARIAPSNHLYFTLKDARSAINVVMFRSAFRRLRFSVADGMALVVRGRISIYEPRGTLQFYAEELEPRGLGALQLAFEQLKERLSREGLFEQARKRPIPFMPRIVGIVTALGGAGLRDMITIMLERFPNLHIIISPARVQGAGAAAEISAAIANLNRDSRAEVIIVGRGGGSLEDLWAFNEETVARAINGSEIPVISAVGHEIDYTIADFAADARAPTPTAAAHMATPIKQELRNRISANSLGMAAAMASVLSAERRRLTHFRTRIRDPRALVRQARQRLDEAGAELTAALSLKLDSQRGQVHGLGGRLRGPNAMMRECRRFIARLALHLTQSATGRVLNSSSRMEKPRTRLTIAFRAALGVHRRKMLEIAARLDSLSPLRVLDRGYAVVINSRDDRALVDAAAANPGDELYIRLKRGRLRARTIGREI
ncbi:MAG: exodeoxyribonuclease VII large subunit [Candidatus Binataceae bacterium]